MFVYILFDFILQTRVDGTVWTELDDMKMYKDIDLADIDRTFSAYQKQLGCGVSPFHCSG